MYFKVYLDNKSDSTVFLFERICLYRKDMHGFASKTEPKVIVTDLFTTTTKQDTITRITRKCLLLS